MIRNIFIPEKIGSYYLFAQKILGIIITKYDVCAVQITAKDRTRILEKTIVQPFNGAEEYEEKVKAALELVKAQVGHIDQLSVGISSASAVCKVLKFPFTSYDKIKMTIAYEMEPLLPFPVTDARIDFVITQINEQEKSAEVFAVAVQNQVIQEYRALFNSVGWDPHIITIDLVAYYQASISHKVPQLLADKKYVIVDIGSAEVRLAYLSHQQLIFLRSLPRGMIDIVRPIAKQLDVSTDVIYEKLAHFGLERTGDESFDTAVKHAFEQVMQDISFAVSSFAQQAGNYRTNAMEIILLPGHRIAGFANYISRITGIPCTEITSTEFVQTLALTQQSPLEEKPDVVMALSTAMNSLENHPCNLLTSQENGQDAPLFKKQLITALGLLTLLLLTLVGTTLWQSYTLNAQSNSAAQEIIDQLQEAFPQAQELQELEGSPESQVEDALGIVKKLVAKDESKIRAYASRSRNSLVRYLSELSTIINKNDIRLTPIKIGFKGDTMTLNGSVGTFNESAQLGNILNQSSLFGKVTPASAFTQTRFNATIELKKPRGAL